MILQLRLLMAAVIFLSLGTAGFADEHGWTEWNAPTATGRSFQSRELDGKVVVISVWGSWCPTCRKQIPILDSLQSSYGGEDVQILAFSLDRSSSDHEQYVRENNVQIPSIFARTGEGLKVVRMLQQTAGRLEAVPTVLIYDRQGRLTRRMVGFFNRKQLEAAIAPLLKE